MHLRGDCCGGVYLFDSFGIEAVRRADALVSRIKEAAKLQPDIKVTPVTLADRIRSMTDEQLAEYMVKYSHNFLDLFLNELYEQENVRVEYPKDLEAAAKILLMVLREEVKE